MFQKTLSIILITGENGKSMHLRFSYEMLFSIGLLLSLIIGGATYMLSEMVDNSSSMKLMDENLFLQSQLQDLQLDIVELERQMELLQMYAVQSKMPNSGGWALEAFPDVAGLEETANIWQRLLVLEQKVQLLYPSILQQAEKVASRKFQYSRIPKKLPIEGYLTSGFRYRIHPITGRRTFHKGVDISVPLSTPIMAPLEGKVIYSGDRGGYGLMLEIDHGLGVTTRYAHNSKLLVKVGEEVVFGQIIAEVGSTGHSTGPHLHYEIRIDGIAVDPLKYVESSN